MSFHKCRYFHEEYSWNIDKNVPFYEVRDEFPCTIQHEGNQRKSSQHHGSSLQEVLVTNNTAICTNAPQHVSVSSPLQPLCSRSPYFILVFDVPLGHSFIWDPWTTTLCASYFPVAEWIRQLVLTLHTEKSIIATDSVQTTAKVFAFHRRLNTVRLRGKILWDKLDIFGG